MLKRLKTAPATEWAIALGLLLSGGVLLNLPEIVPTVATAILTPGGML